MHMCFGEFLPFLDLINYCYRSNFHFYYFCQNKYGEEMVRHHREGFNWREADMNGESLINFILIMCLCNAMIYSYVIHVACIPCLMV
jgi:hypothetical protein